MADSWILNQESKNQLYIWLGKKVKFNTLYRISIDKKTPEAFHQKCNGKGPTLTIARTPTGDIFGGYTSLPWLSLGIYRNDPKGFLFRLVVENEFDPLYVPLTGQDGANAIYDAATYGPTFGNGHDLFFFHATSQACSTNINGTYVVPDGDAFALAGAQNGWTLAELEVIETSQVELLPISWVPVDWSEKTRDELRKQLCQYQPKYYDQLGIKFANILVIGGTGAGKTTFLSTLESVMLGRMSALSPKGKGTDSLTLNLLKYALDGVPGVRIWDTKGWSASTYRTSEMGYIVDGHIPHGFSLQTTMTPESFGFNQMPKAAQKVHVVLILVGAEAVTDSGYMARIREFRDLARARGIPIVLGLTKVDQIDKANLENDAMDGSALTNVFKSTTVRDVIHNLSSASGIDPNYILPIKGYCHEYEHANNIYVDTLALLAVKKLLECADDYFFAKHNTLARLAEENES